MSEYVTVEAHATDQPDVLELVTNQTLSYEPPEVYPDRAAGEEGSPIAQMLFGLGGIAALEISAATLTITREGDVAWEVLIDDVRDALRDFFL